MENFISVPVTTLNALKAKLFSDNGVDLSNIIRDLTIGNNNADLTAINVALVFEGFRPEIDTAPRYEISYKSIGCLSFVSYSLLTDTITFARQTVAKWDDNKNDMVSVQSDIYIDTTTLQNWLEKGTDKQSIIMDVVNRFKKKEL